MIITNKKGTAIDKLTEPGTPVTEAYKVPFTFTGTIDKVTIELQETKAADQAKKAHQQAVVKQALSD